MGISPFTANMNTDAPNDNMVSVTIAAATGWRISFLHSLSTALTASAIARTVILNAHFTTLITSVAMEPGHRAGFAWDCCPELEGPLVLAACTSERASSEEPYPHIATGSWGELLGLWACWIQISPVPMTYPFVRVK